jgi:colicin import membrane protein
MKTINTMRNTLLAALLLGATVTTHAQQAASTTYGTRTTTNPENGKEHIITDKDGKTYEMEYLDGKMTAFSVDNTAIPPEKWPAYKTVIADIQEQLKKDRIQADKDREQAKKDREQARLDRVKALKHREQADRDRLQADKDEKQADLHRQQAEKDREQADSDRSQADEDRKQADLDRQQAEKDRQQAEKDRAQAAIDRAEAEKDRELLDDVISDLVADKLVPSKSAVHELAIDKQGMTLNGQQQSAAVYQKYISKYQGYMKRGIVYRVQNGNVSMWRNN